MLCLATKYEIKCKSYFSLWLTFPCIMYCILAHCACKVNVRTLISSSLCSLPCHHLRPEQIAIYAVYMSALSMVSMKWMFSLSTSTSEICSFFFWQPSESSSEYFSFSSPRWLEIAALQFLTQNGPWLFPLVTGRAGGGFFNRCDMILQIYTLSQMHARIYAHKGQTNSHHCSPLCIYTSVWEQKCIYLIDDVPLYVQWSCRSGMICLWRSLVLIFVCVCAHVLKVRQEEKNTLWDGFFSHYMDPHTQPHTNTPGVMRLSAMALATAPTGMWSCHL